MDNFFLKPILPCLAAKGIIKLPLKLWHITGIKRNSCYGVKNASSENSIEAIWYVIPTHQRVKVDALLKIGRCLQTHKSNTHKTDRNPGEGLQCIYYVSKGSTLNFFNENFQLTCSKIRQHLYKTAFIYLGWHKYFKYKYMYMPEHFAQTALFRNQTMK